MHRAKHLFSSMRVWLFVLAYCITAGVFGGDAPPSPTVTLAYSEPSSTFCCLRTEGGGHVGFTAASVGFAVCMLFASCA